MHAPYQTPLILHYYYCFLHKSNVFFTKLQLLVESILVLKRLVCQESVSDSALTKTQRVSYVLAFPIVSLIAFEMWQVTGVWIAWLHEQFLCCS